MGGCTPSQGWHPPGWWPVTWRDLRQVFTYLEEQMADSAAVVQELADETTAVGERLNELVTEVADLSAKLAAAEPDSQHAADLQAELDDVLAKVKAQATRLHTFGRDPENPTPPAPGDNPDPTGGDPSTGDGGVDTSGDTPL